MKQAKSIYAGGDIVYASECDFTTAKERGLICPLCSQAVFLRSGGVREQTLRNGKKVTQIIDPYFAHYKLDNYVDYDCDNRALTKAGSLEIERQIIESRNQRLKLYNRHLWDLILLDHKVDKDLRSYVNYSSAEPRASYTTDSVAVDFLRPPLRLTSGL